MRPQQWLTIGSARRAARRSEDVLRAQRSAVLDERRRLAREIHDGMAQDLAFIVQQAEALAEEDGASEALAEIATAARRALDESRVAIGDLVRTDEEPLDEALTRVASEAAGRWGAVVAETHAAPGVKMTVPKREALLRIVGEAVTNAARHASPGRILVELAEQPSLHVRIRDDGIGFDTAAPRPHGQYGLAGMRERAEQIGWHLRVASRPGEGTEVVVVLP